MAPIQDPLEMLREYLLSESCSEINEITGRNIFIGGVPSSMLNKDKLPATAMITMTTFIFGGHSIGNLNLMSTPILLNCYGIDMEESNYLGALVAGTLNQVYRKFLSRGILHDCTEVGHQFGATDFDLGWPLSIIKVQVLTSYYAWQEDPEP